jgi:hypothetical protein
MFVSILQVTPPAKTNYERLRDKHVAENNEKMRQLGLKQIAFQINNSLPPPTKGEKQETRTQVVQILKHLSISLTKMIREIVMMMRLNLMCCQYQLQ